jgi:hypothetical protein
VSAPFLFGDSSKSLKRPKAVGWFAPTLQRGRVGEEGEAMRSRSLAVAVGIPTVILCFGAFGAAPAVAQDVASASARSEQAEAILAPGTAILAELNSGLDSKKLKAGDKVAAHVAEPMKSNDGRTIMARGTKLEGHVTQADARNKGGSASILGIQFDKAELKDGTEIALNVVIQAMAPRDSSGPAGRDDDSSPRAIGTNQTSPMGGGHAPPPNSSPQTADTGGGPGSFPGAGGPRLDERSQGAVGMKGITLDSQPVDGRAATIVSSNGKSVKLEDGTRMVLVVQEKKGEATTQ